MHLSQDCSAQSLRHQFTAKVHVRTNIHDEDRQMLQPPTDKVESQISMSVRKKQRCGKAIGIPWPFQGELARYIC